MSQLIRWVLQCVLALVVSGVLYAGIAQFSGSLSRITGLWLVPPSAHPTDSAAPVRQAAPRPPPATQLPDWVSQDHATQELAHIQQQAAMLLNGQIDDALTSPTYPKSETKSESAPSPAEEQTPELNQTTSTTDNRLRWIFALMYLFLFTQTALIINTRWPSGIGCLDRIIRQKQAILADWAVNAPPLVGLIGTLIPLGWVVTQTDAGQMVDFEAQFLRNFATALDTTIMGSLIYVTNYVLMTGIRTDYQPDRC